MASATQDNGSAAPPGDGGRDWRRQYWRRNVWMVLVLLAIWFTVSLGFGVLLIELLNQVVIAGYPLGLWFAQQGSIFTFVILILVYAVWMDRLDDEFGVAERDEDGERL